MNVVNNHFHARQVDRNNDAAGGIMIENPYQSPKYVLEEAGPTENETDKLEYYVCDTRRLTYRELWWLSRSPRLFNFLILTCIKSMHSRPTAINGFANPSAYRLINPHELPESATQRIRPLVGHLESSGFQFVCAYTVPVIGASYSCYLSYRSSDCHTISTIVYVQVRNRSSVNEVATSAFWSIMTSGHILCTTGTKQGLDCPPEWNVVHIPGSGLGEIFERHRARLTVGENSAIILNGASHVMDALSRIENRAFEFQLSRGVYRVALAQEREQLIRLHQHYVTGSLQRASWQKNEVLNTVVFLMSFIASVLLLILRDELPRDFTQSLVLGAILLIISLCAMVFIWRKRLV